jgi:hypothetical protein
MNVKQRLGELERKATGRDSKALAVLWPDGTATVDGEAMPEHELVRRYGGAGMPGVVVIRVVYDDEREYNDSETAS